MKENGPHNKEVFLLFFCFFFCVRSKKNKHIPEGEFKSSNGARMTELITEKKRKKRRNISIKVVLMPKHRKGNIFEKPIMKLFN